MNLPPILDRELRVASRRKGTYRMRLFAAFTVAVIWYLLLIGAHEPSTQLGHHIFLALSVLALGGCLCSGLFLTADCLAQEKREGTLGLIFLANVRGFDVVLGKLGATSLNATLALLAVLPMIGLSLLVGGVTGNEFARLILVLVATLFWSLSIGLAASATSSEARHGMGRCLLVLVLLGGILPALWWCARSIGVPRPTSALLLPSPCYAMLKAFESSFATRSGASEFWKCIGTVGCTGLLALVSAMFWLPRSWQDLSGGRKVKRAPQLRQSLHITTSEAVERSGPMFWLTIRDHRTGVIAGRVLGAVGVIWFGLLVASAGMTTRAEQPFIVGFFLLFGMHVLVKVLVATEATRRMNEDRASGALELLLVTPLATRAILNGQFCGLRDQFRKALALLVLMNASMILIVLVFHQKLHMNAKDQGIFAEVFAGGIVVLVSDFRALRWAGMVEGLTSTKHFRAVLRTLGKIMFPPWVGMFMIIFIKPNMGGAGDVAFLIGLFLLSSIILGLAVGTRAKHILQNRLRHLASLPISK
jgi:hypothetical protein